MHTFRIKFWGRKIGSIGKLCRFSEVVMVESPESAKLKLYADYEHIIRLTIGKI